jgi:hypothetical protein
MILVPLFRNRRPAMSKELDLLPQKATAAWWWEA